MAIEASKWVAAPEDAGAAGLDVAGDGGMISVLLVEFGLSRSKSWLALLLAG